MSNVSKASYNPNTDATTGSPIQRPSLLDVPPHPSTQADDLAEAVEHDDNLSDLNLMIGLVVD